MCVGRTQAAYGMCVHACLPGVRSLFDSYKLKMTTRMRPAALFAMRIVARDVFDQLAFVVHFAFQWRSTYCVHIVLPPFGVWG